VRRGGLLGKGDINPSTRRDARTLVLLQQDLHRSHLELLAELIGREKIIAEGGQLAEKPFIQVRE